jgi:hypothetical protein
MDEAFPPRTSTVGGQLAESSYWKVQPCRSWTLFPPFFSTLPSGLPTATVSHPSNDRLTHCTNVADNLCVHLWGVPATWFLSILIGVTKSDAVAGLVSMAVAVNKTTRPTQRKDEHPLILVGGSAARVSTDLRR